MIRAIPFALLCCAAQAQEVWVSPGAVSWHADRGQYNERNAGMAVEARSGVHSVSAGYYKNSIRQTSRFALYAWQPFQYEVGPIRASIGVAAGLLDGYRINQGRPFPVAMPAVTLDWGRIGVNLTAWPALSKEESAGVGVQFKLKVW